MAHSMPAGRWAGGRAVGLPDRPPHGSLTRAGKPASINGMTAMFEFAGGALSVYSTGSDTEISFELFNVGDAAGIAEVGIEVDGSYVASWNSPELSPGVGDVPKITVGTVPPGNHEALVYVNPGSGQNDHLRQVFEA
jgi:hypothetical protein